MWPFNKKAPVLGAASIPFADTARHAGFFAAHAVWSVSEGEVLIPMLVHPGEGGKASMTRLVSDDSRRAVAEAKTRLADDAARHGAALLLYDTFVTLGDWRTDAIVIEATTGAARLVMAVPYRNAKSEEGFAVYKPKFVECPQEAVQQVAQSFFDGVEGHEKGNGVWTRFIDQSR
jgi:hypothetical protein